jgi:hypothetical protein
LATASVDNASLRAKNSFSSDAGGDVRFGRSLATGDGYEVVVIDGERLFFLSLRFRDLKSVVQ